VQLRRQTVRVDGVRQQKLVVRLVVLSNVCIGGEDDACLGPAAIRLDHEAVGVEVVRVFETARQHQSSAGPSLRLQCQQCTRSSYYDGERIRYLWPQTGHILLHISSVTACLHHATSARRPC